MGLLEDFSWDFSEGFHENSWNFIGVSWNFCHWSDHEIQSQEQISPTVVNRRNRRFFGFRWGLWSVWLYGIIYTVYIYMVDLYDLRLRVQYLRFFVQGKGLHRILMNFTVQRWPIELHDSTIISGTAIPTINPIKVVLKKPLWSLYTAGLKRIPKTNCHHNLQYGWIWVV